jgi:hypothetical protein
MRGTHEVSFEAREMALVIFGETADQSLGDQETQHGIAEKFELLIIIERRPGTGAGPAFVGQGTVGKRAAQ